MADEIWLDVLPSMAGFGADLVKGTAKASKEAGAKAGKTYSKSFGETSTGATDAALKELEASEKRASGLVAKSAGDMSKARNAQRDAAATALLAEQRLADAVAKFGEDSNQAQAASLRLESARDKAATASDKLEAAERALKSAQAGHKETVEQLTRAQGKSNDEVREAPGLWGKFTEKLGGAGEKLKGFADSAGGLATQLAGAVGGAALFGSAFTAGLEKEAGLDKLNARLAATPEQARVYGDAAGGLFANAYGENMEEVTTAVDAVVSSIGGMRDASQSDIEDVTAKALNLATAFDVDVQQAATTTGILMRTGLAKDADEAMDMITGSMNKMPAEMRAEVFPVMNEYSKHFAALGIDGETTMGMITAAAGDGAIGMDKMGDAVKEFTIRSTDMSKATSGAYEALGLDMGEMTNDILAGGDSAEQAMGKIIHGLQGIEDPGEQAAASLALFGTPLEDLGTDKIPDFLGMMDPMGDAFDSTKGSADALNTTLNENTSTSLETVKRSFGAMLNEGIAPLLEPLNGFLVWATETPGVLTAVAVALGVVAAAWAIVTLVASPWLAIGVGIALVIAGIVLAVQNWGAIMQWFGERWEAITGWVSERWEAMTGAVSSFWRTEVQPTLDTMGAAFKLLWDTYVKPHLDWIKGKWEEVSGALKSTYDATLKPLFDAFGSLIEGDLPGAFESGMEAIGGIWGTLGNIARKPVNFVINTVYNNGLRKAINSVADKLGLDKVKLPEWDEIPAFAKGGVAKPGWALVGEEGPELVNFDQPGRVYTAEETQNALGLSDAGLRAAAGDRPEEAMLPMGGWWDNIKAGAAKAWDTASGWVRGGLATAAGWVLNPIKDGLGALLPNNVWGDMGRGASAQTIDGVLDWIRGKDEADAAAGLAVYDGAMGAFHRPSRGPITSKFGPRWGSFHAGVDIAGGGPTYAALNGVVAKTGWNIVPGRTGLGILLNHADDFWTYYGHNPVGGIQVRPGQQVKAGQHIGYQGATGNVTGTHLHFETQRGRVGAAVNPMSYMYDQGGYLQPGVTQVLNKTGKPEPVLTPEQDKYLQAVADGRGAGNVVYEIHAADGQQARELVDELMFQRRRAARGGTPR